MKVTLVLLVTLGVALSEPPVPSSQYLPSNQYGAPRPFSPPSNQYVPPSQTTVSFKPSNQYIPPSTQYGAPSQTSGGYGGSGHGGGGYDDQSEPANYQFEYHVQDAQSGNDFGHKESRQGDVAQGKYFVLLPDGRKQIVEYTADSTGYHPKISYEDVGTGAGGGYSSGRGNSGYQY